MLYEINITARNKKIYRTNQELIKDFNVIQHRFSRFGVPRYKFKITIFDSDGNEWIAKDFSQHLPTLQELNNTDVTIWKHIRLSYHHKYQLNDF
jgi:hypothetical protein